MAHSKIPKGDFELFYLSELTRRRVKPLSRWEKPLDPSLQSWLKNSGLRVDAIPRKTLNGGKIFETVFSGSSRYIDLYRRKFSGTVLNKSPETKRMEGFLFGYPSCCVEQFILHPYIKNNIDRNDQRKLFHWACPHCRVTPELLDDYLPIHQDVLEWYQQIFGNPAKSSNKLLQKLSVAAAMALWLGAASLKGQVIPDTLHFIPVPNDQDHDGLSYAEEIYLGSNFMSEYTLPGINDNIYWTQFFYFIIQNLPTSPQVDRPYRQDFPAYGMETCQKCGAQINMGFVKVVNPMRTLEINIPYMGLHFLLNHCFSYDGSLHSGRIDIDTLKQILFPYDPYHMLPVAGDSDGDGLTDAEEDSLNFDPGNPDTNGDSIPDGAEVAEQLIRLFPKLKEQADSIHTKIIYFPAWGMENCVVCGSAHNMGFIEFQNPENGRTFQIHFNGLHALAQGSFAYSGTTNLNQRANAVDIYRTMKTHMLQIIDDTDNDGLTDDEEAHFGYNPALTDTDGDGICDGMELALSMGTVLDSLPTTPQTYAPYVLHHPTFGHWNCLICGQPVNMGYLEVVNPLINCPPIEITYYAYHFLKKGSFAYEGRIGGGQWTEGRIDPIQLADYIIYPVGIEPGPTIGVAKTFELLQNYPNPFNSETVIRYRLSVVGEVELSIYDLLGRKVCTLVSERMPAGEHQVKWDGRDDTGREVSSGIYIYQLKAGNNLQSHKMLLLR